MKKYLKIQKGDFDKFNFKINWDWDLYFRLNKWLILKRLLKNITNEKN